MTSSSPHPKPRREVRQFFKSWRKFRNLTLEQLAERVGYTHGTLSRIERGANFDAKFLAALAEALSCEPADLLMRDPLSASNIWSVWENAKPGEREKIVEVAKVIVGDRTGTDG